MACHPPWPIFFFNDTATTDIYTFPYTTLFRSGRRAGEPPPGHGSARTRQIAVRTRSPGAQQAPRGVPGPLADADMTMAEFTENLRSFWTDLDRRGRAAILAGAVLVIVIAAVFAVWALQRDYQVLFKDLAQRDAAAVVAELKRLKVPYRIDADGSTLRVPADTVHETRLALMGRGVPLSGGVGFELFDNHDLSTTEYTQRINYQRALQGELARTIMSIEGVKLVRVHLVLPESSIFKRDKSRPKASVSVVLAPGGSLTESQILGVQRLVAASTPGLEAGIVNIVDQRGVT